MAGFTDRLRSLARGSLGFTLEERMAGTHRYRRDFPAGGVAVGEERPLELRARWGHSRLGAFLSPLSGEFLTAELEGTLDASGLCRAASIHGTLELRYFVDASIRYRFEFEAVDGARYRFLGEKRDLRPWNLHRTHTLCRGTIARAEASERDEGAVLSDVSVRFDLAQLPEFLTSFRLG